jgi:hypothetical protein
MRFAYPSVRCDLPGRVASVIRHVVRVPEKRPAYTPPHTRHQWAPGCYSAPFTPASQDCLARLYVDSSRASFRTKSAAQHHSIFIELRNLSWLTPASRTLHVRNTQGLRGGVEAPHVFGNLLVFVSRCHDDGRLLNEIYHAIPPVKISTSISGLCAARSSC